MNKTSLSVIPHVFNEIEIDQRKFDGYVNATAMCKACDKLFADYNRLSITKEYLEALSSDMGIPISQLVMVKKGNTRLFQQGTWVHPDVALNLAQWLSPQFAVKVSQWVREWMITGENPIKAVDLDRMQSRKQLRTEHRLYLTDTIKEHLEIIGEYHPSSKETKAVFSQIHDEINLIITGETAQEMRKRTGIDPHELLRDYFPLEKLTYYSALTVSVANAIKEGYEPLFAVHLAAKRVLPLYFRPESIQIVEPIKELEQKVLNQLVRQNYKRLALSTN